MDDVLDLYAQPHAADEPLICTDEASTQWLRDLGGSLPMRPGSPKREGYHSERRGTQAPFLFLDPVRGWRGATAGPASIGPSRFASCWTRTTRTPAE